MCWWGCSKHSGRLQQHKSHHPKPRIGMWVDKLQRPIKVFPYRGVHQSTLLIPTPLASMTLASKTLGWKSLFAVLFPGRAYISSQETNRMLVWKPFILAGNCEARLLCANTSDFQPEQVRVWLPPSYLASWQFCSSVGEFLSCDAAVIILLLRCSATAQLITGRRREEYALYNVLKVKENPCLWEFLVNFFAELVYYKVLSRVQKLILATFEAAIHNTDAEVHLAMMPKFLNLFK